MEPERIAERSGRTGVRSLEPLGGGITNRNFKVTLLDGAEVVLRIGGKDTELLGIDRDHEHAATRMAADIGLAPGGDRVRRAGGLPGDPLHRGRPGPVDEVRTRGPAGDRRLALRRLHEGPAIPGRFDSFRVVEAYCATASRALCAPSGRRIRRRRGSPTGSSGPRRAAAGPLPRRSSERELHHRRRAHLDRRLGVRGDGRPLLRPRRTSPSTTSSPPTRTRSSSRLYFGEVR